MITLLILEVLFEGVYTVKASKSIPIGNEGWVLNGAGGWDEILRIESLVLLVKE